jgi:hypothetical protein
VGLKGWDKSSQIWRQVFSDTWELVMIANHHLPPSSKSHHHGAFGR